MFVGPNFDTMREDSIVYWLWKVFFCFRQYTNWMLCECVGVLVNYNTVKHGEFDAFLTFKVKCWLEHFFSSFVCSHWNASVYRKMNWIHKTNIKLIHRNSLQESNQMMRKEFIKFNEITLVLMVRRLVSCGSTTFCLATASFETTQEL